MVSKLILAVDAEAINLDMIERVLEGDGYKMIRAYNTKSAMELIQTHRTGLSAILMDLNIPGYDGHVAIKTIKSHPILRMIPVMALSPSCDKESVIKALQAGADDYLTKPFNPDELLSRVHILCRISDFVKKWK